MKSLSTLSRTTGGMKFGLSDSPEASSSITFGWPWTRSRISFSSSKRIWSSAETPRCSTLMATWRRNMVLDWVHSSSPRYALAKRPEPSSIGVPCSSTTNAYERAREMYGVPLA